MNEQKYMVRVYVRDRMFQSAPLTEDYLRTLVEGYYSPGGGVMTFPHDVGGRMVSVRTEIIDVFTYDTVGD